MIKKIQITTQNYFKAWLVFYLATLVIYFVLVKLMAIFNLDFLYSSANTDNISSENYIYALLFTVPITFPIFYFCVSNYFPKSFLKSEILNYLYAWLVLIGLSCMVTLLSSFIISSFIYPTLIQTVTKGYLVTNSIDLQESYNLSRQFIYLNAFCLFPSYSYFVFVITVKYKILKNLV